MLVVAIGIASLIASNHQGTVTPPPSLGLKITNISNATPALGETVTISWEYENPELLEAQGIRVVSLLIDGNLFTLQQGCLPTYEPGQECLNSDARSTEINFTGPITVFIDSVDNNNQAVTKAVKLKLPNMSFKLSQLEFTNPGYPRFTGNNLAEIEFDKAFGIYANVQQSSSEDGIIDGIASIGIPGFDATESDPFFGFSSRPNENISFGFRKGSKFPLLDPNFLNSLTSQQQAWSSNHADGIIYAGLLAINGEAKIIKTASGEATVYTINSPEPIEPFFVQIDIRSTDLAPSTLYISDLHAGNAGQGLVLSAYRGDFDPDVQLGSTGSYSLEINPTDTLDILASNGDIKGATVGFPIVETSAGENLLLVRAGLSATWSNIPFYPDDDLSGLFLTQFQEPSLS